MPAIHTTVFVAATTALINAAEILRNAIEGDSFEILTEEINNFNDTLSAWGDQCNTFAEALSIATEDIDIGFRRSERQNEEDD